MARSGLRRYPRELLRSLLGQNHPASEPDIPVDPQMARQELASVWLGHATVLLRFGGLWILTDPVLSARIGIRIGNRVFGVGRMQPNVLEVDHLPPIDLVLISHAHFDHLDRQTLRKLVNGQTRVVTATRTRRLIPRGFGSVEELPWESRTTYRGVGIRAIRPEHWGARSALDRRRGYNSYVLDGGGRRVLFAGDTAFTQAFDDLGQIDLAIFGIGAYEPWEHQHATPEQVWKMFVASGARHLMPVHHSTFPLSDEPVDEPMARLLAAAGDEAGRIVGSRAGEMWCSEPLRGTESHKLPKG